MSPDLVLHNARILTSAAPRPATTALAVWRDRIAALGSDDDLLSWASPGTHVVDARGMPVCPGFWDCHVHLSSWAMLAGGRQVDLEGAGSLQEALERLRTAAPGVPAGGWLRGRGWDKNRWPEGRFPTAADLDAVTGDVPAALPSHDGHSLWANSAAMRIAAVGPDVADPPGGRVLRNADGTPSGLFQEAANGLVWPHVPEPTLAEITSALSEALPKASALGLVGLHNCESGDGMRAVQSLRERGELPLRIVRYCPAHLLPELSGVGLWSGFGDEWVRLGGVKAFLDGSLGAQTAAMLEPYEGSDDRGVLTMEYDELEQLLQRATDARLAVALHAIGDRAVHVALDAFAAVRARSEGSWPRHRIEHAQHLVSGDIQRFADLGITASMQPAHMLADIETCARYAGEQRSRWAFPLASLAAAGVNLAFGSDAPVETICPMMGIRSAMERRSWGGAPAGGWFPEERLTAEQAISGYTIGAAYAAGLEQTTGSLRAGNLADFVLLSHDIRSLPLDELQQVEVVATVVGGRAVHDPRGVFAR